MRWICLRRNPEEALQRHQDVIGQARGDVGPWTVLPQLCDPVEVWWCRPRQGARPSVTTLVWSRFGLAFCHILTLCIGQSPLKQNPQRISKATEQGHSGCTTSHKWKTILVWECFVCVWDKE